MISCRTIKGVVVPVVALVAFNVLSVSASAWDIAMNITSPSATPLVQWTEGNPGAVT